MIICRGCRLFAEVAANNMSGSQALARPQKIFPPQSQRQGAELNFQSLQTQPTQLIYINSIFCLSEYSPRKKYGVTLFPFASVQ